MKDVMVRFIDCHVPTETCNFRCPYCYITQRKKFTKEILPIGKSPEEVKQALSMKRWGGVCFINFCAGGETLLGEDILPIIYAVLEEGHYVQIVTNGSMSTRFEEIAKWPQNLLNHLFIKFSFHFSELKRLNIVEKFFANVLTVKNAGASISLEITPGDEMIPYIDEMKEISIKYLGALPHVTVARNENTSGFEILSKYSKEEYEKIWGQFESPMFDLKMKLVSERRTEFCYGGEWTFFLNLKTGDLKQCYRGDIIDNIYQNIEEPIHFKPIGRKCPESYCYNGHAWMTLGAIPNIKVPFYSEIRDRQCEKGDNWLKKDMRDFFSQKLENKHVIYRENKVIPRALLFGDSICEGYENCVRDKLKGKIDVFYSYRNIQHSAYFLRYAAELAEIHRLGSDIDVVHFNVGLWDILRLYGDEPLISIDEYQKNLKRIYKRIRYVFPNAKLIFATTTPINESETEYKLLRSNSDVDLYNQKAVAVMEELGVAIDDLYTLALKISGEEYLDMVHFSKKGYEILGEQVAKTIEDILNQ